VSVTTRTLPLAASASASWRYSRPFCWLPMILIRFIRSSNGETTSGLASAPMRTSRPSGRSPRIESAIASIELLVARTTRAPPAGAARPGAGGGPRGAAGGGEERVLAGRAGGGDLSPPPRLGVRHGGAPEPADADDGDALARLRSRPAEPRPDGVAGAEDR